MTFIISILRVPDDSKIEGSRLSPKIAISKTFLTVRIMDLHRLLRTQQFVHLQRYPPKTSTRDFQNLWANK